MEPRSPSDSRSTLVRWMGVEDTNHSGMVHGGMVMKLCDEVAAIAAIRHSGLRAVTVAMDRMTFLEPVHIGELMTFKASVNATWRTSMEVGVRVEAENTRTRRKRHTSTAYLTMVALDDDTNPAEIPPLVVETEIQRHRQHEAELRRRNRLAERDEIVSHRDLRE